MRNRILVIGLVLALLAGCSPEESGGEPGRAAVVMIHGDGELLSACVEFDDGPISGLELLKRSGWEYQIDAGNAMGVLVCRIGEEGCSFPAQDCLCDCPAGQPCRYWAYFNRDLEGSWTYGAFGASRRQISDGSMDAWVWLTSASTDEAAAPVLESLTFAEVCPPAD